MSEFEPKSNPRSSEAEHEKEFYDLATLVISGVEDALMDEDPGVDRSDLWFATWSELRAPTEGYMDTHEQMNRKAAQTEIYEMYMHGLAEIYPELDSIETDHELLLHVAMIPNLPECEGRYVVSNYESADGKIRMLKYTEVRFGNFGISRSVDIFEDHLDGRRYYSLAVDVTGAAFGVVDRQCEANLDEIELEFLERVHPLAVNDLWRIMHAQIMPYDLETKLAEIRILSEETTDADEINSIINHARAKYHAALAKNVEGFLLGRSDLRLDDLRSMNEIITERIDQLDPDT